MYPVATGMSNGDMITIIGASGGVFYSDIRFANGSWSGWSQIPALPGNAGYDLAISGDKNGALQVMAIDGNGPTGQYGIQTNIYHNIWFSPPNGGWQGWALPTQPPQPTNSPSQSRIVTAATTPDGNTQFVDVTGTPDSSIQVYGDIRYTANGLWQGWHQMPTPAGTYLDTSQGVPIAAPAWVNFSADEVWADAPTFCPS
jgi:hypothetical protein